MIANGESFSWPKEEKLTGAAAKFCSNCGVKLPFASNFCPVGHYPHELGLYLFIGNVKSSYASLRFLTLRIAQTCGRKAIAVDPVVEILYSKLLTTCITQTISSLLLRKLADS